VGFDKVSLGNRGLSMVNSAFEKSGADYSVTQSYPSEKRIAQPHHRESLKNRHCCSQRRLSFEISVTG
jgi:hypothetical protein